MLHPIQLERVMEEEEKQREGFPQKKNKKKKQRGAGRQKNEEKEKWGCDRRVQQQPASHHRGLTGAIQT